MPTPAEIEYYVANLLYRCARCYHTLNNNTRHVVVDQIDHVTCEAYLECVNCGARADYYAYGLWEGGSYRKQFETQHPKAAELLQKLVELSRSAK